MRLGPRTVARFDLFGQKAGNATLVVRNRKGEPLNADGGRWHFALIAASAIRDRHRQYQRHQFLIHARTNVMTLGSNLFKDNGGLAQCEVSDPAHVTPGDTGEHVRLIQIALHEIDGATIAGIELTNSKYGASTAAAVLAYKTKRHIINRAYQSSPDYIVGKMTIGALDKDMLALQTTPSSRSTRCFLR
jgi:hypothetical protein